MALEHIPTWHFVEYETDNEYARRAAAAENTSRPATVEVKHVSTGLGQQRVKEPLIFPVVFRTEPHFTQGSAVILNPDPKVWADPIGTAGVYAWKRDKRGFFLGAYCWVRVDMSRLDGGIIADNQRATLGNFIQRERMLGWRIGNTKRGSMEERFARWDLEQTKRAYTAAMTRDKAKVQHYLTFSAVAVKDLPTRTLHANLNPRGTGI